MKNKLMPHEASGTWINVKSYIPTLVAATLMNIGGKALVDGQEYL